MICGIILLISLTCVCGTFVVNVTQTSYQAEENDNITLDWMFTTKPDSSSTSLNIFCELSTDVKRLVLYNLYEGVEVSESQDGQFAGRVQCDKDALREGRIRLHVSRLRTDDSGVYQCEVSTDYGWSFDGCRLSVTAAVDQTKPQKPTARPQPESRERISLYVGPTAAVDQPKSQKPTARPQPESRGWIGLYIGLAVAGLVVCVGLCLAFKHCLKPDER